MNGKSTRCFSPYGILHYDNYAALAVWIFAKKRMIPEEAIALYAVRDVFVKRSTCKENAEDMHRTWSQFCDYSEVDDSGNYYDEKTVIAEYKTKKDADNACKDLSNKQIAKILKSAWVQNGQYGLGRAYIQIGLNKYIL